VIEMEAWPSRLETTVIGTPEASAIPRLSRGRLAEQSVTGLGVAYALTD